MVTPSFMRQSVVHLLAPVHDFAQVVTFVSSSGLPIAQSVGFTQAPTAVPHEPASSPGGSEASVPPPPAPPVPGSPPPPAPPPPATVDPAEVDPVDVEPLAPVVAALVDPDEVEPDPLAADELPPVVAALAPAPPPDPSLPPPHATSAAPNNQHQRVPPNPRLDIGCSRVSPPTPCASDHVHVVTWATV
jgi:hypothetical protein